MLLLVCTIGLGYAASTLFNQFYSYTVPTRKMTVTGLSTLDFGTLSLTPNASITFNGALIVSGSSITPITIHLVLPDTTWQRVFASLRIDVLNVPNCGQGEFCPAQLFWACVSFGNPTCLGRSATFTPAAGTYAYLVKYTVVSGEIPSNVPLQTTWSP